MTESPWDQTIARGLPRAREILSSIETTTPAVPDAVRIIQAKAAHASAIAAVEAASTAQARLLTQVLALGYDPLFTSEEWLMIEQRLRYLLGFPPTKLDTAADVEGEAGA